MAGACVLCLSATGITLVPQTPVYAAEYTTTSVGLPTIGLAANLFCQSDTADATNVNLQWNIDLGGNNVDHYVVYRVKAGGSFVSCYETKGKLYQEYDQVIGQNCIIIQIITGIRQPYMK